MAGASALRGLRDEDLEAVHHQMRRDADPDVEIARWVEKKLGKKIGKNDHAKAMVICRYRRSGVYVRWLELWENRRNELERDVALQRERFEMMSSLVKGGDESGFETMSRGIQARLLTMAAEASDEELREAAAGRGWIKNMLRIVQEQAKISMRAVGEKAVKTVEDKKLSAEEKQRRIKEIFGMV